MLNKSGKLTYVALIVFSITLLTLIFYTFSQQSQRSGSNQAQQVAQTNYDEIILNVNRLFEQAHIGYAKSWENGVVCGPLDEFEGYILQYETNTITTQQANLLKTAAQEQGYTIDNFGERLIPKTLSFSIHSEQWGHFFVLYDTLEPELETSPHVHITIPVQKSIEEYPTSTNAFCG